MELMNDKTILEIRQSTEALLRQALMIWHNSDFAEQLEGLEDDPVFRMLMTALATQFKDIDGEIENLRQQVMEEFAGMFIPYEVNEVAPTAILIETQTTEDVPETQLDSNTTFTERNSGLSFMPMFRTRVLNASISKITRIDGRRWRVTVDFPEGVSSLDWFTFAIDGLVFRDLTVWCGTRELNLIRPWGQHDLPYTEAFDFNVKLFNHSHVMNSVYVSMDLLTKRDISFYCFGEQGDLTLDEETKSLDFIFEFFGIDEDFVLERSRLHLNVSPLLNTQINTVTLTTEKPFARVSDENGQKFVEVLPPSAEHIFSRYEVYVRKVMSDRFNAGSLIRLLDCLLGKFHTDFYAFQMLGQQEGETMMRSVTSLLQKLRSMVLTSGTPMSEGVYLFLKDENDKLFKASSSYDIRYLTSNGALPEGALTRDSLFSTPLGLDNSKTRQIMEPIEGSGRKSLNQDPVAAASYYLITSDRLVTAADIRAFCTFTLTDSFSIGKEMIRRIDIKCEESEQSRVGYYVQVTITLVNNAIMRKAVGERLPRIESVFENLIAARSVNIYPVSVSIVLK